MNTSDVTIRLMESNDIHEIALAFQELGWNKPASQYERYLVEQVLELRDVYVAFLVGPFAGYLTICCKSFTAISPYGNWHTTHGQGRK